MLKAMLQRTSRRFRDPSTYQADSSQFHLLPFRFHRLCEEREVLVNEVGDYLICPRGTARRVVQREVRPEETLYADLKSGFFISEDAVPDLIDVLATRYRTKKSFMDDFTSLHIFVVTLRCNHSCHYCQVSRQTADKYGFDISYEDLDRALDLTFKSPAPSITIEFQGGEPLRLGSGVLHRHWHVGHIRPDGQRSHAHRN